MAQTITSFTPSTGPANGGTVVTITGTNLDITDAVYVGTVQGQIISHSGTTGLTFRVPAGTAGTAKIHVYDVATDSSVVSTGDFTYSAAASTTLVGTLNRDWQVDVKISGSYVGVEAMTPTWARTGGARP